MEASAVRVALLRVLGERHLEDLLQGLGELGPALHGGHQGIEEDGPHQGGLSWRIERFGAREQLVEDRPERVHIHASVQGLGAHLLGCHVRQLAFDDARLRPVVLARCLGNAKVHHLHAPLP
jgi:hypothetical protein